MKSKKLVGVSLMVIGIILFLVSLLADSVGLGNRTVFGWRQMAGSLAGVAALTCGLILFFRK